MLDEEELLDYDQTDDTPASETRASNAFRDFLLKPELLHAVVDCGYEHPSEVQCQAIPQAILGTDILCQGKSGMGKTAVFILATLQQLQPTDGQVSIIVLCHVAELAFQISRDYERLCKYLTNIKVSVFFGGVPTKIDEGVLKKNYSDVVVGTPGRILALAKTKTLNLHHIKHFIIDECDQVLESLKMRRDVYEIFRKTPSEKQVLMFSATLNKQIRSVCKQLMQEPMEIYIDDERKLTHHGLLQYYVKLREKHKNRKLIDLLDHLEFHQAVIFINSAPRCTAVCNLLVSQNFPAVEIYPGIFREERLKRYKEFQAFQTRILVATDVFARGMDIERVNIVINYDTPETTDIYLHRIARAGRFGTKGLAITFVASKSDAALLNEAQNRFDVDNTEMPEKIDYSTYMKTHSLPGPADINEACIP